MASEPTEPLINAYQDLLIREYSKLEASSFEFENSGSRLAGKDVDQVVRVHGQTLKDLLNQKLLVEYPDNSYRTLHFDLIFRAINLRAAYWSKKIPLEFKVGRPRDEYIPSFSEVGLDDLRKSISLPPKLLDPLIKALSEAGYPQLAFHQLYYLKEMQEKKHRTYLLVSPTASGKSLIFYLVIIISILKNLERTGSKALILYPRKALASDQLMKFLRIIYILNEFLKKNGLREIRLGIDDGDTPRSAASDKVREQQVFRGLTCIQKGCKGSLRYGAVTNNARVVCESCKKVYAEIAASKDDIWTTSPDIIFSNLSAINRRMMMPVCQKLMRDSLEWIVLDEAHVYREELGGHAHWLIKRILARFKILVESDCAFVISSATIHKPEAFVSKLVGTDYSFYYEPFDNVVELSKQKKRKLTLDLIVAPNPNRSAESLAQELALLLGVWGYSHQKKTLLFIDNTAEVERLSEFVTRIIISERKEHNDHLNPSIVKQVTDVSYPFSWKSIAPSITEIAPERLAETYNYHYADLPPNQRAHVEENFKSQKSGLLFSTSTLELGIDIGDIAAIIQYKIPISAESYVQRVGRAGRTDRVLRVALGILVVTNSPSQVRYILGDEYLRLVSPQVEIPVAWENEEIKKQHITYAILDSLAWKGHPTYLDFTTEIKGVWTNVSDFLQDLRNLVAEVKRDFPFLKGYVSLLDQGASAQKILEEILEHIEARIAEGEAQLNNVNTGNVEDSISKLRVAEDEVLGAVRQVEGIRKKIDELTNEIPLSELAAYKDSLFDVETSIREVLDELEKVWRR